MDDRETQQESQEEMNESGASDRESEEIPEKIIIESGNTSGRSSAAIEISVDDMENGKDFDDEKEEDSSSVTRSQNESAYRSPITSLQPEPNEYEDDFENDSMSEGGSDAGRRQVAESDDEQDEDNIGSVSDGEDQDFTGVNLQNGHFSLRDMERAPSSSTDELMAGYREGGSVVSDRFSDFSTQYHIQPQSQQSDSTPSPSRGSKFDRLRSAYTRPMKQRPPAHLPPHVERSRPSYGYYMDSDELQRLEDSLRDDYTVLGEDNQPAKLPARVREIITKHLQDDEDYTPPTMSTTPTVGQLQEENRLLATELNRVEDLLAASRAERDELGIKYNAISDKVFGGIGTVRWLY